MAASYRATPVFESLFTSEYCKIFKSIFFEKHLQTTGTAASENVFMKLRKIKIYSSGVLTLHFKKGFFNINIRSKLCLFLFHDWFHFFSRNHFLEGSFYFQWRGFIFKWGSPMRGIRFWCEGFSKKSYEERVPAHTLPPGETLYHPKNLKN